MKYLLRRGRKATGARGPGELPSAVASTVVVVALIGVLAVMFGQRADRVSDLQAQPAAAQLSAQPVDSLAGAPTPDTVAIPVAPVPDGPGPVLPGPLAPRISAADRPPVTLDEHGLPIPAQPGPAPRQSTFSAAELAAAPRVAVVLFDQVDDPARITGLRRALIAGGWTVAATDSWRGRIPATTVYYPAGMEASARALMQAFPSISRIRPAFRGIPSDRLSVIVCSDLPAM